MSNPVVYIGIGNSDDKLPQKRWAVFYAFVRASVRAAARAEGGAVVFEGASPTSSGYQNAVWALHLPDDPAVIARLRNDLRELAGTFEQDSIAWAVCPATDFLTPDPVVMERRRRWMCRRVDKVEAAA